MAKNFVKRLLHPDGGWIVETAISRATLPDLRVCAYRSGGGRHRDALKEQEIAQF